MKSKGYWGKILRVDLTNEEITTEEISDEMAEKWIGGVGLATKIVYDEVPEDADPLGPENVFVYAVGPFPGTGILGSGRYVACAKSPLSGIWGESLGGGYNAKEMKKAGFDAIVVTGKAEKPVYLWVHDGEAELKDASHLWGKKDSFETEDAIKEELGDENIRIAPIGPAAEKLVRYAGIFANYGHGCAGRTGMGAVMGSKNLKAIAFRGTMDVEIANPDELKSIKKELLPIIQDADFTKDNRELGQAMAVVPREESGLLPMKNFAEGNWKEGALEIGAGSGGKFNDVLNPTPDACAPCVMGCHRRVTVEEPKKYAMDNYGPEYETLGMMGSNCLIDDLKAINKANELCNRLGLDTIDFGGICAFAMEAYERGIITKEDLGFELEWGDGDAMIKLLKKVAKRDGEIPTLLGEGLRPAGEELNCPEIALHVNGMAVPAHDPRAFFSMAVETATSTRGACHLHGFPEAIELGVTFPEASPELDEQLDRHAVEKKGLAAAKFQDRQAVNNSLPWCFFYEFSGVTPEYITKLLNAVTGWNLEYSDLLKAGERIINLQRMFNLKHGMDPKVDEKLPARIMTPHEEGGAQDKIPPFEKMMEEYYKVKDWPEGIPTKSKLKELGLDFAIEDLPK